MDAIENTGCVDTFKINEAITKSYLQIKRFNSMVTTCEFALGLNYFQTLC